MEPIFSHTIGRADYLGGALRLELVTLQPGGQSGGPGTPAAPSTEVTHVVFMPLEGFLSAVATLDSLVLKLAEAGLVRPAAAAGPATAGPAAAGPLGSGVGRGAAPVTAVAPPAGAGASSAAPSAVAPPFSPNFG